ncbi:MAG: hypothetical protein WBF81_00105 [Thermoplasmata archaeon]
MRHRPNAVGFERAPIGLARYPGNTPPRIAVLALESEGCTRGVIRAWNEQGMAVLKPKGGPDDPRSSPTTRERIPSGTG